MINKGKLTEDIIKGLKAENPGSPLMKWTTPDGQDDIVFKPISQDLLQKILSMIRDSELQGRGLPINDVNDKIFETCVLYPKFTIEEKFSFPVGLVPSVVKSIQEKSCFIDVDIFGRVLAPDSMTTIVKDFEYWNDITDTEADTLKQESKPFALFRVRLGRWSFVIRPLTRVDIQVASQSNDDELTLAKAITMWPKNINWEHIPAGVVSLLGKEANSISGWSDSPTVEAL